jgi:hypothetical protein
MSSGSPPVNSSGYFLLDGIHSFDPKSLGFQQDGARLALTCALSSFVLSVRITRPDMLSHQRTLPVAFHLGFKQQGNSTQCIVWLSSNRITINTQIKRVSRSRAVPPFVLWDLDPMTRHSFTSSYPALPCSSADETSKQLNKMYCFDLCIYF